MSVASILETCCTAYKKNLVHTVHILYLSGITAMVVDVLTASGLFGNSVVMLHEQEASGYVLSQ